MVVLKVSPHHLLMAQDVIDYELILHLLAHLCAGAQASSPGRHCHFGRK
jgi:hypothetical protein